MDRKPGHLPKDVQGVVDSLIWVKVVGVGNTASGKTCLIKHFCESKFNPGYQPTVGVDYGFKIQEIRGIDLRVHLWDLSGSTDYLDVRNELFGGTDAVFLAYDVTNAASFENLDSWLREVKKYSQNTPEIVLVGNKADMKHKRAVTHADAKKWAVQNKLSYYETSAMTGDGVLTLFSELLDNVLSRRGTGKSGPSKGQKWDARKLSELCSPVPSRAKSAKVL